MRFSVKESEKFKFIDMIRSEFEATGHRVDTLDGVKIIFEDGWISFRPSNTEAKIMVCYESRNKEEFEKMREIANQVIERIPK